MSGLGEPQVTKVQELSIKIIDLEDALWNFNEFIRSRNNNF